MLLPSWTLLAFFLLVMVALLALLLQARSRWDRICTLFLMLTLPWALAAWIWLPPDASRWLAALPVLLLAVGMGWLLASRSGQDVSPSSAGEGMTTQEAMRGPAGTRQALTLYFSLLLVVAVLFLVAGLWGLRGGL